MKKKLLTTAFLLLILISLVSASSCEKGENPWNNPDNCTSINLDTLLCLEKDACVWSEDWFMKRFIFVLLGITAYLIYKDLR